MQTLDIGIYQKGSDTMDTTCKHYKIKINVCEGRCGYGYIADAECVDCGQELDVVEVNGWKVE